MIPNIRDSILGIAGFRFMQVRIKEWCDSVLSMIEILTANALFIEVGGETAVYGTGFVGIYNNQIYENI